MARRNNLKTNAAIVGRIPNQQHTRIVQFVRFVQRALHQSQADALPLMAGMHRKRPQQQRISLPNLNPPIANRSQQLSVIPERHER